MGQLETSPRVLLSERGFAVDAAGLWRDPDQEVGVAVREGVAFVGWLDIVWAAPASPGFRLHSVTELPGFSTSRISSQPLDEAIAAARAAFRAHLLTCSYCGASRRPGAMHNPSACHGCAEAHLGVVH